MRFTQPLQRILRFVFAAALFSGQARLERTAAQAIDEPSVVITPNTIRIELLEKSAKEGHWVVMPGFGELGSPSFARDGEWIAFDGYKDGYNNSAPESWIVRRDGSGLTRLTTGATPRWSPDGKQLLVVRDEAQEPERLPGIFIVNRDGSGARRIVDGRWPDWSPSGKQIVLSVGGERGGGVRIGATIFTMSADGTEPIEIVEGDCPSWSPDGKKIAYCYRAKNRPPSIRTYDLHTNQVETLGIGWFRANWLPDSKSVVANGLIGRETRMVRFWLGGEREPSDLPTEFARPSSPCTTWDGKEIVYIARKPKS